MPTLLILTDCYFSKMDTKISFILNVLLETCHSTIKQWSLCSLFLNLGGSRGFATASNNRVQQKWCHRNSNVRLEKYCALLPASFLDSSAPLQQSDFPEAAILQGSPNYSTWRNLKSIWRAILPVSSSFSHLLFHHLNT